RQFLFDPDRLEPGELAQPDLEDVLGLPIRQREALDEGGLGLVGFADDPDHLVDVEQHQLPSFEDMDPVLDLAEAMAATTGDGREPELAPFDEDRRKALLAGPAVDADHHEVDRDIGLEAGMRKESVDEVPLFDLAAARLALEPHRSLLA